MVNSTRLLEAGLVSRPALAGTDPMGGTDPAFHGKIGVLALQGDFQNHLDLLRSGGIECSAVRFAEQLDEVAGLIIPGGESTTMLKLIDRYGLRKPLVERLTSGLAAFGTCAGAIVMSRGVSNGEQPLGVLPVDIERNAYGRQIDSFESEVRIPQLGRAVKGIFIRAPIIRAVDEEVEVVASYEGHPVLVRFNNILASTFHPELAGDSAIHRFFIDRLCRQAA